MNDDFLGNDLVAKFELMLDNNGNEYFDTEELTEIIAFYLDIGDLIFAQRAIKYGTSLHPKSLALKIKLLEYSLEVGLLTQAHDLIEELSSFGVSEFDFVLCKAKYWTEKDQHDKAIQFYKEALNYNEESDYIHNCLGSEYLAINEIGKAIYHFKLALEIDLDDAFAFYSVVDCFNEVHRHKDCINFIKQFIDLKPYSDYAWVQLGLQHLALKQYEEATIAFDYSILINPKGISAYMQKGLSLEKQNKHASAIEVYTESLEYDESAAFTHLKIGECYKTMDLHMKALKAFHKSIHENPQLDKAWSAASDIYENLGNYEDAIYYLKRALDLDGLNVNYWKRTAFLYVKTGKFEESEVAYRKIIKIEPDNFYNWFGFAEVLLMLGEYKKAESTLLKALKTFKRAELYYQLSYCYFLMNDDVNGEASLKLAQELNPDLLEDIFLKYPIIKTRLNNKAKKDKLHKK